MQKGCCKPGGQQDWPGKHSGVLWSEEEDTQRLTAEGMVDIQENKKLCDTGAEKSFERSLVHD
jgi:hypothetical protein